MINENKIDEIKNDFLLKAEIYKFVYQEQRKEEELQWKIKLSFIAFIGVLLSIVFANRQNFSDIFLSLLSILVCTSFIILIFELILSVKNTHTALIQQDRKVALAKIRHIASLEPELDEYGKEAESLLITEESERNLMKKGLPLSTIIKPKINYLFFIFFILWLLLYLSLSLLLFFEFNIHPMMNTSINKSIISEKDMTTSTFK